MTIKQLATVVIAASLEADYMESTIGNYNMIACQPRPFRITTDCDADVTEPIPDLVQRDFSATGPGTVSTRLPKVPSLIGSSLVFYTLDRSF